MFSHLVWNWVLTTIILIFASRTKQKVYHIQRKLWTVEMNLSSSKLTPWVQENSSRSTIKKIDTCGLFAKWTVALWQSKYCFIVVASKQVRARGY
jgi:hypothetical protein